MKHFILFIALVAPSFLRAEQNFTLKPGSSITLSDLSSPAEITCIGNNSSKVPCFCERYYEYGIFYYQVRALYGALKIQLSEPFLAEKNGKDQCLKELDTFSQCD